MGNNCVHGRTGEEDGALCSVSRLFWSSKSPDDMTMASKQETDAHVKPPGVVKIEHEVVIKPSSSDSKVKPVITVQAAAATEQVIMIVKEKPPNPKAKIEHEVVIKPSSFDSKVKPVITVQAAAATEQVIMIVTEKPPNPKAKMSMGLQVLKTKIGHFEERFNLGYKLGHGRFGTTFLCIERKTGKKFACKSIAKTKLQYRENLEDVRREIEIMHHLSGHHNVVSIEGAYEDAVAVRVVMELCGGGELFYRIKERGHYSEKKAAELTRTIFGVLESCHSLGVMHRDLKLENILFVSKAEDSPMKIIDFGLSVFFRPGEVFSDVVGSPYYIAPEVLCKHHGPEADVWSAGVIVYILLCGKPPFWDESQHEIFKKVLYGEIDFSSHPWPNISESAKDLVKRMLARDPRRRITAHQVLFHLWVQYGGVAPDEPIHSAVLSRMRQFSAMNKLKKMAIRVIAESLCEEEIAGLRAMFNAIDSDSSGYITFDKLKNGLRRYGANLKESEIYDLMKAADIDNNGAIDYGEFIAATLHLNKIDKDDHLLRAFSYFDKDGSGYITQDELQRACEEFGIQDFHLEEMIQEADQNNDGRIDYNEFVAMMHEGNTDFSKKRFKNNFGVGFREAMPVC